MSLRIGRLGWVGVAFEASYNAPTSPTDYIPFTENSLKGKQEPIANTAAYGIREQQISSEIGKKSSEGSIGFNVDSKLSVYMLGGVMGTINSANVAGTVYDHTMSRNNTNTPKSLTIINDRGVDREIFTGVAVSQVELALSDGLANVKASLMGHFPVTSSSGTLTTASGGLYDFKDASFAVGSTVAAAASAANLKPHDFKLTINNNSKGVWRHGSADLDTVNHGEFNVEAEATIYFETTVERDNYYANIRNAAVFKLSGNGLAGGYNESLTANFYQMRTDSWDLETGISDFYAEKLKMVAEYDQANAKSFEMVARNNKSSY